MDDLSPGERFAGCRIEAVAGRGGMGVVYRATDLALSRRVALKVVAADGVDRDFTERFGREVRLAASIDHPNIVPVYGAGEEGGRLYLVMRYVDGTDLQALLRSAGRLEQARAARIVAQLAAALDAAHASGLVHRDVKPANVLLTTGEDHVYLTDFGLTVEVEVDARITTTGQWIGSVDYMAPEQLRAEPLDARTDVYALGGVLYAALTGKPPFSRGTVPQTIAAHLDDPPPRPSAFAPVDPVFDAVIARALAKHPPDRYRSAGDLGRAAQAAARGERLTSGGRTVARGPAAPSDDPTARLPANGAGGPPRTRRLVPTPPPPAPAPPPPARGGTVGGGRPARGGVAAGRPARGGGVASGRRARAPRRRRRIVAGVAGLATLAGAGAAVGLVLDRATPRTVSASLSAGEVRDVAEDFAAAYGREDAEALRATLARNVERVAPDGAQAGRQTVLAVYRRQFAAAEIGAYELDDVEVVAGAAGRAAGRYTVERAGREDITGRVAFGVVREGGRPKIALIATQPD